MDLRSEKSGNRGCGRKERQCLREARGFGERRECQPACRECHHAGMDKKGCSTRLELGEHCKTYSLDWKNGFTDILVHGFLSLTAMLLLCNTRVWIYSCVGDTLFFSLS